MIKVPQRVKEALKSGRFLKNYRIDVYEPDNETNVLFTIDNDTLVSESVDIDERMCTGKELKFGLCEGSNIEFKYFNHPNINGKRIKVNLDVEYQSEKHAERIEKNAFLGDDYAFNVSFDVDVPNNTEITILGHTVAGANGLYYRYSYQLADATGDIITKNEYINDKKGVTGSYTLKIKENREIKRVILTYYVSQGAQVVNFALSYQVPQKSTHTIPIGWFNVSSCPMEFDTRIYKAKAFNKLQSDYLDKKANQEIIEAVIKGESGLASSGASIQTILDNLLGGYAIQVEPNVFYKAYPDDSIESAGLFINGSLSRGKWERGKLLADGKYLLIKGVSVTIKPLEKIYEASEYYRFNIDTKALNDYLLNQRYEYDYNVDLKDYYRYSVYQAEPDEELVNADYYNNLSKLYQYNNITITDGDRVIYSSVISDKEIITPWFTGLTNNTVSHLNIVTAYELSDTYREDTTYEDIVEAETGYNDIKNYTTDVITVEKRKLTDIEKVKVTTEEVEGWQDITLRDLQSAVFEMSCLFGRLDRITDLFSGLELNNRRLYPSDSLYPSNELYPLSTSDNAEPSQYEKLWTDSVGVQNWKYLIITYRGIGDDGNPVEKTLQRTIHEDGTTNYNMSSNWLFKNLIWTPEQIGKYADAMVEKMRDVTWIPFEMWSAGLPYLEAGDEIEITNKEGTFTSYILQRKLKGIQYLTDDIINGELDVF